MIGLLLSSTFDYHTLSKTDNAYVISLNISPPRSHLTIGVGYLREGIGTG